MINSGWNYIFVVASFEKGFTRFQALYRGHQVRQLAIKRAYDQAHRDNVAKEILSTEREYVSNLSVCIEVLN